MPISASFATSCPSTPRIGKKTGGLRKDEKEECAELEHWRVAEAEAGTLLEKEGVPFGRLPLVKSWVSPYSWESISSIARSL